MISLSDIVVNILLHMQSSFLPRLRKYCLTAFCHAVLEKQNVKMILISQEMPYTLSKSP